MAQYGILIFLLFNLAMLVVLFRPGHLFFIIILPSLLAVTSGLQPEHLHGSYLFSVKGGLCDVYHII
jgi:hypothetical protein